MTQSFEVFNVYGKKPEAINSIVQAFFMILEQHDMRDINGAFKHWMQENSTFPTPADILAITKSLARDRREAETAPQKPAAPRNDRVADAVPWHRLMWSQCTHEHKEAIYAHLGELGTEKAKEYWAYLQAHCGFPHWDSNEL